MIHRLAESKSGICKQVAQPNAFVVPFNRWMGDAVHDLNNYNCDECNQDGLHHRYIAKARNVAENSF